MGNTNCLTLSTKEEEHQHQKVYTINGDQPDTSFCKEIADDLTHLPCDVNHIRTEFINQKLEPYEPLQKGSFHKDSFFQIEGYDLYYCGDWKKGIPHGQGQAILKDGSYFKGFFKHGKACGKKCLFVSKNGAYYIGQVSQNFRRGKGRLVHNKYSYEGDWQDNLPHGKGTQVFENRDIYQGTFVKGKKEGKGIYRWENGTFKQYKGNFEDNLIAQQGELQKRDGTSINGQFRFQDFHLDINNCHIQSKKYELSGHLNEGKLSSKYEYQSKGIIYRINKSKDSVLTGQMIQNDKQKYKIFRNKKLIHYDSNFNQEELWVILLSIEKGYIQAKKHSQVLTNLGKSLSQYDFKWWQSGKNKIQGIAIVPICGRYIIVDQKQDK